MKYHYYIGGPYDKQLCKHTDRHFKKEFAKEYEEFNSSSRTYDGISAIYIHESIIPEVKNATHNR